MVWGDVVSQHRGRQRCCCRWCDLNCSDISITGTQTFKTDDVRAWLRFHTPQACRQVDALNVTFDTFSWLCSQGFKNMCQVLGVSLNGYAISCSWPPVFGYWFLHCTVCIFGLQFSFIKVKEQGDLLSPFWGRIAHKTATSQSRGAWGEPRTHYSLKTEGDERICPRLGR